MGRGVISLVLPQSKGMPGGGSSSAGVFATVGGGPAFTGIAGFKVLCCSDSGNVFSVNWHCQHRPCRSPDDNNS